MCVFMRAALCVCGLVDANYSRGLTVTSITVSHAEQSAKQQAHTHTHTETHTHSHVSCARAHANLSVQIHIYARPHKNAHDTCIHHPSPHTHTHTHTLSMYIFQPPWPSFFFVLFRLFPSPLFLSLCPHLLSCWLWIMYYILMEWEKLARGYHSPLNDH